MSVKSVMESEEVLLAKTAPVFANLSKMVKSSSFISNSSGTASMMSSASRIASFTSAAVEISESALSRAAASTFPRATPSSNDWRIQAIAFSSTCEETSSSTVLYPPRAAAYAMPRPIVPAPMTVMVFTSTRCSLQGGVQPGRRKKGTIYRAPTRENGASHAVDPPRPKSALVARDGGIDFEGPALDSAGQRLCFLESLKTQPRRRVQASHAVMAVANHFVRVRQSVQAGRERTERNKLRALDTADFEFPRLAHIHEDEVFTAVEPGLHFRRQDFEILHLFSFPERLAFFEECANAFLRIVGLHQLGQVYAFGFFELLQKTGGMQLRQSFARQAKHF